MAGRSQSNPSSVKARLSPSRSHSKELWLLRLHWQPQSKRNEVMDLTTQGKLLIVDDEYSVRDSLAKWFHEEGYSVTTAEDATDALSKLAADKFDAALVDIKMRGTDGIELQRRMHEADSDLVVIMMTGYASVETAVTALKNGAYDYVT